MLMQSLLEIVMKSLSISQENEYWTAVLKNDKKETSNTARIRELCNYIQSSIDKPLRLKELSEHAGLSAYYLQRIFKSVIGLTPRQYIEACRLELFKKSLRDQEGQLVTNAIYEAGFASPSRIYERVDNRLGMTPTQYRRGGKNLSVSYVIIQTELGLMMMAASDRGLCFIQFGADKIQMVRELGCEYPAASITEMKKPYSHQFKLWMKAISDYLKGLRIDFDLPLDIQATAFQFRVWNYLQSIPYGATQSYAQVAKGIGMPKAARAVGRACGSNRLAIVIPCHRVIRDNGEMGGYRWGLAYKRKLIRREQAARGTQKDFERRQ
jgi:AraC family transcriptional regulator, regulatory protein of adaptative response / methylated-DNA-[protein]-cysteine methyltransferase